ncbi:MAG TPA: response regulator, partial [Pirellulales bacterium]|nr:response regulator [Pirellulales bacterium]
MKRIAILLVDDDRHILESMAGWLREQGYTIDTADSHLSAVAALKKKRYELVLADIRLGDGDGDGFDVLAWCREHAKDTTVILITGYGTVETAIDAIRAGA